MLCAQRGLKVIDFGIASAADSVSLTRTGFIVGTTGWMAPEQVNGEKVLPLTDIFCWASVIYFAATGAGSVRRGLAGQRALPGGRQRSRPVRTRSSSRRLRPLLAAAFRKAPRERPAAPDLLEYLLPKRPQARGPPPEAPAFRHQALRLQPGPAAASPLPPHPSGPQPAPVFTPNPALPQATVVSVDTATGIPTARVRSRLPTGRTGSASCKPGRFARLRRPKDR